MKHDHTNTITPMPVVVVNGMQIQLLNKVFLNKVLWNFAGLNNGAGVEIMTKTKRKIEEIEAEVKPI